MRVCIIGGGLAGVLMAWRLAQRDQVGHIDLVLGSHTAHDATGLSGGVVRAYEPHPEQRRLAVDSLRELRESRVLRRWSRYRETGSVYLRPNDHALRAEVEELAEARLLSIRDLADLGWAQLPVNTAGILEGRAGYISPRRLRAGLLADLAVRPSVTVVPAAAEVVQTRDDGPVSCMAQGRRCDYDLAVLAAGAWTPSVMNASGLRVDGLRTKSIQYTVYSVAGNVPPPFVDETTGLYGCPVAGGGLLLGLATEEWDVVAGPRPLTAGLHASARRIAGVRLPHLEIGSAVATVNGTDCYSDPPILSLRPVAGTAGRVVTFTGGSGGSVKTALAASRRAADQLVGLAASPQRCPLDLMESESA